jgi:hypothetical protein
VTGKLRAFAPNPGLNAFGLMPGDLIRVELLTRRAFEGTVAWCVPPYCGIKFTQLVAEDDPLLPKMTSS